MKSWRHGLAGITVAVLVVADPSGGACGADTKDAVRPNVNLNIEAQPLGDALTEFARQSGLQVMLFAKVSAGLNAPRIVGAFAPEDALRLLLQRTDLKYEYVNERTVAIRTVRAGATRAFEADGISLPEEEWRLAQVQDPTPAVQAPPQEAKAADAARNDEIVVTGTNIRGVRQIAAPTLTFTREEIEKTGYSGLEQLFEALPQNFDSVSFDGVMGERMLGAGDNRADRASGINLRGLGAGSTLTLLNGSRRAGSVSGTTVDISTIPLSVIEQVEVVTGGRSAIYGSDAVGGVVNLVTRRDFTGVETQAQYGFAADGGDRLQFSTITGLDLARGGLVAAYDYQRDWALDLVDTGLYNSPIPVSGIVLLGNDIRPDASRHSGFLSGRFSVSERVELHADGLYTRKEHDSSFSQIFAGATNESFQLDNTVDDTYSVSGGVRTDLAGTWALDVSVGLSAAEKESRIRQHFDLGAFVLDNNNIDDTTATVTSATVVASGPLMSIGAIAPRAAFGVEAREEGLKRYQVLSGMVFRNLDRERSVNSVFGELLAPVSTRLDLSLAGRYDDYEDFGGTFNPDVGLIWKPTRRVTLRGAYSTAFRGPALIEIGSSNSVVLQNFSDPNAGGALVPVLVWSGENPALEPETATTWSVGVDFAPAFAPGARISLSYFDIEYEDRISTAAGGADFPLVLQRQARYVGLIDRSPTAGQAGAIMATDSDGVIFNATGTAFNPATQDILTVFPGLIVFDNRTNNIAVETVKGLDLALNFDVEAGPGWLNFAANASYALEHKRHVTVSSPSFELLNETGYPVDLRVRANAGWTRGLYGVFLYLNYVDAYSNPLVTPAAQMKSWTTVDLTVRLGGAAPGAAGWLGGASATLSVENLLNRDPPHLDGGNAGGGYRYDAANASALGRFVALRLTKKW
jgi:outer membrane receptor protein involved in Fe transport